VAFDDNFFYIWNPSIGFLKQLPDPGFSSISNTKELRFYGVGYLLATDNYKGVVASFNLTEKKEEVEMFSLRAHLWKRIQVPSNSYVFDQGTLVNEALHWVEEIKDGILVFDLALEEFSKMRLPNFHQHGDFLINLGVSFGGCLCVCRHPRAACHSIDFWVMREYDVRGDSWTKLFNLKLSNPPLELRHYRDLLVMESCIVAKSYNGSWLVRIDLKEEDKLEMYKTTGSWLNMIPYEESLLQI
jgi:F-box interacting protein